MSKFSGYRELPLTVYVVFWWTSIVLSLPGVLS